MAGDWRHTPRHYARSVLRMTSGLSFKEDYEDHSSDVIQMLFVKGDKAGFAASKPLQYSPGSHWSYSSGTSNIIARILEQRFTEKRDYLRFPREQLFATSGHAQCSIGTGRSRHFCRLLLHVCLCTRLGAAWPLVLTRRSLAGPTPAAGRLGELWPDPNARRAGCSLRSPHLA